MSTLTPPTPSYPSLARAPVERKRDCGWEGRRDVGAALAGSWRSNGRSGLESGNEPETRRRGFGRRR